MKTSALFKQTVTWGFISSTVLFTPQSTGALISTLNPVTNIQDSSKLTFKVIDQIAQTGSWEDFKLKLGQRETGEPNPPYNIENSLGFIGKYQFGEALLIDLEYYQAEVFYNGGENGVDKNHWKGTWTGKEGINSKEDFLNNNNVQEIAIKEAFNLFWNRITSELAIENYLGGSVEGVPITCSGILAAAHLRGEYGVINLLRNGYITRDEYNTSILEYLDEFQGYQTPYCQ